MNFKDGYSTINDVPIYYKYFESKGASKTLVVLHGGPGATHDMDLPLAELSDRGISVFFYDQYGCGKSGETPDYPSRFTTEYYMDELEQLRRSVLEGRKIYVMGHSWGGMLGLAYATKHQDQMHALISTGGISSVPFYTNEVNTWIEALPDELKQAIHKYERLGDYSNPEYLKAVDYFYHEHLLRLKDWPPEMYIGMKSIDERKVYKTWWGPNEFRATGKLKDWDITSEIEVIRIPTLVTTSTYDEVSPNVAKLIQKHIPGSRLVQFQNSSHCPMWEEREEYLKTLETFIKEN